MDPKLLQEFELPSPNTSIDGVPCKAGAKVFAENFDLVRTGQFLSEKEYKKLIKPPPKPKAKKKAEK